MAAEFVVITIVVDDYCGSGMLAVVADWHIFRKSSKNRFHWDVVCSMSQQSAARSTGSTGDHCSLWLGVVSIIVNNGICVVVAVIFVIVSYCKLVALLLELCSTALFRVVTRVAKKASQLAVQLVILFQMAARLTGVC